MRTVITNMELSKWIEFSEDSVITTFEASHLGMKQPKRRWRALVDSAAVNCDLTAALALSASTRIFNYKWVQPLYMNVTDQASMRLLLGPTLDSVQDPGTASYDSLLVSCWRSFDDNLFRYPRKHNWFELPEEMNYPFARFIIDDTDNPNGFVEVGNLIFHPGYSPESSVQAWPGIQPREELRQSVSAGGARHRQERPVERVGDCIFRASGINARAEALKWLAFEHTIGISKPICLLIDADVSDIVDAGYVDTMDYIVYGLLEGIERVDLAGSYGEYSWAIKVGELL